MKHGKKSIRNACLAVAAALALLALVVLLLGVHAQRQGAQAGLHIFVNASANLAGNISIKAQLFNSGSYVLPLRRNESYVLLLFRNTSFIQDEYPCRADTYAIAVALYRGCFPNISELAYQNPLFFEKPVFGHIFCPYFIISYKAVIYPKSDVLGYFSTVSNSLIANVPGNFSISTNGYWKVANESAYQFVRFAPGNYTVVAVSPYIRAYALECFEVK
ncbi:MAG: hypothetical protein ACP5TJ_00155 [Candidatus Micrarchaeia archaeon]